MSGPKWFKLYSDELLIKSEMLALSDDQLGKLVRLWAIASKEDCSLPSDLGIVANILRAPSVESLEWVRRFFRVSSDDPSLMVSERMRSEMSAYTTKCSKNKINGARGGTARQEKNQANLKRTPSDRSSIRLANAQAKPKRTLSKRLSVRLNGRANSKRSLSECSSVC